MMNKDRFDALTAEEQAALTQAAAETEVWLKPLYEGWVDEQVAAAIEEGGTETTLSTEQSIALIDSVKSTWDATVDEACGAGLAGQVRDLLASHQP